MKTKILKSPLNMSIRLTLLRLNEQSLALCPLKCLALLMNFLDKIAMKAALQRLVEAGVAPKSGKPIDYDTAATPGNTSGTQVLLLTDEALYLGLNDKLFGHHRIPFETIGKTEVTRERNSATYEAFNTNGELLFRVFVRTARASFIERFRNLGNL